MKKDWKAWAKGFFSEMHDTLHRIAENPTFYTFCDSTKSIRDAALSKFPFVIIVEVIEDIILVTNVHHTSKEPK